MKLRLALIFVLLLASGAVWAGFFHGGVQSGTSAPGTITSVTVTPGTFLGGSADGTSAGAIAVNLSSGLAFTGTVAVLSVSPDGTTSSAPGGAALITADGTWAWSIAAGSGRPGEYTLTLNGAPNIGIGTTMEVSNGGQLFVNTTNTGWFVWQGGQFVSSSAPTGGSGPPVILFRRSSSTLPSNLLTNGVQPAGTYVVNIAPTQAGLTNSGKPFPVTITGTASQTIASITPTSCPFTAGTQNGAVCNLSVAMMPASPASTAAITLTGANSGGFHLNGMGCANISTGTCTVEQSASVGGTPQGTYTDVSVVATQPAVAQTLLPLAPQQSNLNTTVPTFQFLAGSGSANRSLGTLVGAAIFQPSPAFAGTYSLGGADATRFVINSTTGVVSVGSSDVAAGNYALVITVSQQNVVGSPVSTPISLQGVDIADTSTLFLAADNYYPAPGSIVHVTVRNTPNASGTDYVSFLLHYPRIYTNWNQTFVGAAGTHNAVLSLTVPNPSDDNYQFLRVFLTPNNGQPSGASIVTPTILATPSISYSPPTAPNTLAPPFVPSQTLTVCPSGCQYTLLSLALIGLSNSNHSNTADNVLITMKAGAYEDCQQFGNVSPFTAPTDDHLWHIPPHIWIKGIGGDFARLEGMDNLNFTCQGKGIIVYWGGNSDFLTLDNLEIADAIPTSPSAGVYVGTGNVTIRNSKIHDNEMCVITGNNGLFDFAFQNVHFLQCGGSAGPAHDVYIGDDARSVTADHSIFEKPLTGHAFKTRANYTSIICNIFRTNVDLFFNGTLTVDFAEFLTATLKNNSLVTGPGGAQQNMLGVGDDTERVGQSSSSTISGNTLTVGGFVGGSLFEIGQVIQGTGVTAATITAQTSGTTGQNGTYTLSGPSQTISTPQTINATFSSSGILDFENNIWANDNTNNFWGFYLLQVPTWMKSPPDPLTNNEYVAMPFPYSSNKTGGSTGYPDTSQITETGSVSYASRTAAGLPAAPVAPPPPGCTGTVGNMAVP